MTESWSLVALQGYKNRKNNAVIYKRTTADTLVCDRQNGNITHDDGFFLLLSYL